MAFASSNLADSLRDTLIGLNQNPYPHVECLETKRRASVALILRIRPHYEHRPESSLSCELGKDESPDGFLNSMQSPLPLANYLTYYYPATEMR
jgi:hypothetical protein